MGVEQRVVAEDGVGLWARRDGVGDGVVCCHGGPGLWDFLGDVAVLLADRAAVYRWDQRGCGRSERRGPYSFARSVADLDAVRRHFGRERVALLGHSYGADLALRYALAHPERVSGLVYVSGTGIDASWATDSLARALPRADRVLLDGAGHLPWVERPEEFRAAVGDFLAGRGPGPGATRPGAAHP
ncbi:alpha/beta fold hydrolase [Actinacidiphila sp. bgisy145]|uniref:alpha/beta fold hydrolase n=1 Tax=Actinacidiphila sp. bgisy145 TaxID=3413792 RepID=UPI003EB971F0